MALCAAPALASASVLVIGDSLTVGDEATLKQAIPGVQVNAQVGRPAATGVSILASTYSGQDVVVFDLGTNDDPSQPGAILSDLQRVRGIASRACIVVATINRPPYNGTSYDAMNHTIERFASSDGNTVVVPWQLATKLHPEVVGPDGVHVTPYGYEFRGHLIATAISECPNGSGQVQVGPPGGGSPPAATPSTAPATPSPTPSPSPPPAPNPAPKPFSIQAFVFSVRDLASSLIVAGVRSVGQELAGGP